MPGHGQYNVTYLKYNGVLYKSTKSTESVRTFYTSFPSDLKFKHYPAILESLQVLYNYGPTI